MMALGGVATGNIKANDAAMTVETIKPKGCICIAPASAAMKAMSAMR